jgi:putative ABC transport system permease protein
MGVGLGKASFRRLLAEGELTVALLLGWVMLVALLCAIPIYSDAVNQRLLARELARAPWGGPAYGFQFVYGGGSTTGPDLATYEAVCAYMDDRLPRDLGLPRELQLHYAQSDTLQAYRLEGGAATRDQLLGVVKLGFLQGMEDEVLLTEGRSPDPAAGTPEVLLSQTYANEINLRVDEELLLFRPDSPALERDDIVGERERVVRVVGTWAPRDEDAAAWYVPAHRFERVLLMDPVAYMGLAEREELVTPFHSLGWYAVFEGSRVHAPQVPTYLRRITEVEARVASILPGLVLGESPVVALERFQRDAAAQTVRLFGFLLPSLGLVIYFVVLVASGAVHRQRLEIAMLKSRGASVAQVALTYVLQAGVLAVVSLAVGPVVGRALAKAIGATRGFLAFGTREPLQAMLTPQALQYAVVGVAAASLATLIPALTAARQTVVVVRQQRAPSQRPLWQRLHLDLILFGVAAYGLYVLRSRGYLLELDREATTATLSDPVTFLVPALVMAAAGLLAVRLFPLLVRGPAWLVKRTRSVSLMLSLSNLSGSSKAYAGLLLTLSLTTALGAYTASAARTMDRNQADQIAYQVGADMVLRESQAGGEGGGIAWESLTAAGSGGATSWSAYPVEGHLDARGVLAATRVGKWPALLLESRPQVSGTLLGVDRATFAEAAMFRDDMAMTSLGALMNGLAMNQDGVIVTRGVLEQSGFRLGDRVRLSVRLDETEAVVLPVAIVGVVELLPTVYPPEEQGFACNLDYLAQQAGQDLPFRVWLDTDPRVPAEEIVESVTAEGYNVLGWTSAHEMIAEAQRAPERTGLYGFLSVAFLATVLLSMLAQVLYALLDLRRRQIQLGMARALGLSLGQLAVALASELVIVTTAGIGVGVLAGVVSSHAFLGYLQVGYYARDLVPPFEVVVAWGDIGWAVGALGAMSLLTTGAIVWHLLRIRVFEVLKLGEVYG